MKRKIAAFFSSVLRIAAFSACGFISVFLLMSGYESVYNKSLPLVHTVDTVDLRPFSGIYDLEGAANHTDKSYGTYGKPKTIKLPGRSARLDITQPLQDGGQWLARANTFHLLIPAPPRSGNIGVALLYCRANLQTFTQNNLPAEGSNIFIDTDHNWRYLYKVTNATVNPETQPYIASDNGASGKLIIGCVDDAAKVVMTVEATLLSVQGIE
ncbi:MAG TPA: hypothetical protein VFZ48_02660 [Candidatus Saccharimonadales bacterium]